LPDDRNAVIATKYRARFANLRVVLLVESVAIAALLAGGLWLIQDLRQGGQIISGLLNVRHWLLVLAVSGFGTVASWAPTTSGSAGLKKC
jgi:hypothetical protein